MTPADDSTLDLRNRVLDIDGVYLAFKQERIENRYPSKMIISSAQEETLLAEWRNSSYEEPAPESLDGHALWGFKVQVRD